MSPESFKAAGEALWGGRWIAAMARSLHCSTRSVRRWAAGSWPVPDGVEHDVALLLATRQAAIAEMTAHSINSVIRDEYGHVEGDPNSPRWRRVPLPFTPLHEGFVRDPVTVEKIKAPATVEVQLRDNSSTSPATFEIAHPPAKPPRWMIDEERRKLEKGTQ